VVKNILKEKVGKGYKLKAFELRDMLIQIMDLLYKVFNDLTKEEGKVKKKVDKVLINRRLYKADQLLSKIIKVFK